MLKTLALGGALLAALATVGGGARAEVVLRIGNEGEPETLDQHRTSVVTESRILKDMYEGLTVYAADGEVVPGVAESWEISDDGRTYLFTIREDARWSNGDPVTAEDFVFSFRRILTPETGAKYANILYPIGNAEAVNTGEMTPDALMARAVDERTLEVVLEAPTAYFLEQLTHQTGLPVHPASVEAHGDDFVRPRNIVTNGAFVLEEQVPQGHIRLARNPEYHAADEVFFDAVMYLPYEDRSAGLRAFRAGELDVYRDVPSDQIQWMRENLADEFRVAPWLAVYYYAIAAYKPPFDDARVRQALSMAIDRETLVEQITASGELPAYSLVPPGVHNYEAQPVEWAEVPYAERVEQAQALLAEAGFGPDNPLSLEIRYNTSENHRKVAIAIAAMWEPLGVDVSLFNTDIATHYAHLRDRGDFDVARAGWIADYNDAQNFLFLLEADNVGFNYARYDNPAFDDLMKQAEAEVDWEARRALLQEAERILMADQPYIPIYHYVSQNLVSSRVQGWEDNIVDVHLSRFLSFADQ